MFSNSIKFKGYSTNELLFPNFLFLSFGPQFGLEIGGGGLSSPGPSPGSATAFAAVERDAKF